MTTDLKSQIKKRQMALARGNVTLFKYYRNLVNRNRKKCRSKYYLSKVHNLKNSRPKNWRKEVKRISGHSPVNNHSDLISLLANAIDNFDYMSPEDVANSINSFLDLQQAYTPLDEFAKIQVQTNNTSEIFNLTTSLQVNELDTYKSLKSLNPDKSSGPDGISPWVYKAYVEILAYPVSVILNCSYNQGKLPSIWKSANISPIPKETQITNINKHLRPISLTPILSKVAE